MPELKSKQQHADAAAILAQSYELVQRGPVTYIPVDWQALTPSPVGDRIWLPFDRESKMRLANQHSNILFANDSELRNFEFMLKQIATPHEGKVSSILVKTQAGLRVLNEEGQLVPHDGAFTPNYVQVMLNDDEAAKAFVLDTIAEWVGGEEEAHSLLHHLATSLAPGFSPVKYVLLIGKGRNGKSLLLQMVSGLYGPENVSNVTRQMMAERSPVCVELNDKLLNLVFDGEMTYIKDSSMEKTLIAGEAGYVRMLYESGTTRVQTNALFVEALNQEPKARDKSSALQKRLVRYQFSNVYPIDKAFEARMLGADMLGALLALLIEHYVRPDELAVKLAPTAKSLELQVEQAWLSSPVLQFLDHLNATNPAALDKILDGKMPVDAFLNSFTPWLNGQGINDRSDGEVLSMLKNNFDIGLLAGTKGKVLTRVHPETELVINQLRGVASVVTADSEEVLVGD